MKLLVLNGPNINMVGIREKHIYGEETYEGLCKKLTNKCAELNVDLEIYQTNHEGCLVDKIQESYQKIDGIIFNPGAYTHTSIAILDALKAVQIPCIEVHISDVSLREDFRQISYIRTYCFKSIIGHGLKGYEEAIDEMIAHLQ